MNRLLLTVLAHTPANTARNVRRALRHPGAESARRWAAYALQFAPLGGEASRCGRCAQVSR